MIRTKIVLGLHTDIKFQQMPLLSSCMLFLGLQFPGRINLQTRIKHLVIWRRQVMLSNSVWHTMKAISFLHPQTNEDTSQWSLVSFSWSCTTNTFQVTSSYMEIFSLRKWVHLQYVALTLEGFSSTSWPNSIWKICCQLHVLEIQCISILAIRQGNNQDGRTSQGCRNEWEI